MLNDSSVLSKSVLLSRAVLSRIIPTVKHSYCLPPLTGLHLKRYNWNNTINCDGGCCLTSIAPVKCSPALKMSLLAYFLLVCMFEDKVVNLFLPM